jgi:hypothetical protein
VFASGAVCACAAGVTAISAVVARRRCLSIERPPEK